jgi:hypothetical protein
VTFGGDPVLVAAAALLLLAAHAARAARWAFLFPKKHAHTGRFALLVGLGIGYAVNALVPLRVGELVRGAVVTRLKKLRFAEVMATIVAERTADLAVLAALIAASGAAADRPEAAAAAALFAAGALAALGFAGLIRRSAGARRLYWRAAGIFNTRIRLALADFAWSTAETLLGGALLRWRFLAASAGMWALYLAAYAAFGRTIGAGILDVVSALLRNPLGALALGSGSPAGSAARIGLLAFVLAPVALILLFGVATQSRALARAADVVLRFGKSGLGAPRPQSDRFSAPSSYESFLAALFSGEDRAVSGFGMEAVDDCVVHKFFHGGSDAITALVETEQRLLIRKFAVGPAASRLKIQADWIRRHAAPDLPLVTLIGDRTGTAAYSYDMPLVTPANDFYDVIHSSSAERNRERLLTVLERADNLHGQTAAGEASDAVVRRYLDEKVRANADAILDFARRRIGGDAFSINDLACDLSDWDCLSDPCWLEAQIARRGAATIHGDLTIENVIIAPDHPHGLYIIDPNPENIFDTPLIDWAKLMQSLHLGYETLNRGISCSLSGQAITLAAARSQAYAQLHETLEQEIRARFGEDGLREVYFHELVNYLRLTTYKIRQCPQRGLGFFACTALLLQRYRERWA